MRFLQRTRIAFRKFEILLRLILFIVGIVMAAIGGVIAYRALFLEPSSTMIVTSNEVRELPNTFRVAGGIAVLIFGACIAFIAGRKTLS